MNVFFLHFVPCRRYTAGPKVVLFMQRSGLFRKQSEHEFYGIKNVENVFKATSEVVNPWPATVLTRPDGIWAPSLPTRLASVGSVWGRGRIRTSPHGDWQSWHNPRISRYKTINPFSTGLDKTVALGTTFNLSFATTSNLFILKLTPLPFSNERRRD